MKHITIGVPDSQFSFFMKLINSLSFPVSVKQNDDNQFVDNEESEILNNIEIGLKQMSEVKSGKRTARPVVELLKEVSDEQN